MAAMHCAAATSSMRPPPANIGRLASAAAGWFRLQPSGRPTRSTLRPQLHE